MMLCQELREAGQRADQEGPWDSRQGTPEVAVITPSNGKNRGGLARRKASGHQGIQAPERRQEADCYNVLPGEGERL